MVLVDCGGGGEWRESTEVTGCLWDVEGSGWRGVEGDEYRRGGEGGDERVTLRQELVVGWSVVKKWKVE